MRVAIAYRGVFNFQRINRVGVDSDILSDIQEVLDNHKDNLYNVFDGSDIDFYFSTYDIDQSINEIYESNLNLKYYGYIPTSMNPDDRWRVHRDHCKNLITQIREQIERSRDSYDLYIFTRPDIKFLKDLKSLEWDYSKFNILMEHLSGNCDDNFFIFPTEFLDSFDQSIDSLIKGGRITHEINHELVKRSVPIKYHVEYTKEEYLGHNVFEFCK